MRFALRDKPSAPVLLVDEQILRLYAPSLLGAREDLSFGLLELLSYRQTQRLCMQTLMTLTFFRCLENLHWSRSLLQLRLPYPVVPLGERRSLDEVLPLTFVRLCIEECVRGGTFCINSAVHHSRRHVWLRVRLDARG